MERFPNRVPSDPDRDEGVPREGSERDRERQRLVRRLHHDPFAKPAENRAREEQRPDVVGFEIRDDQEKDERHQRISQPGDRPFAQRIARTFARPKQEFGKEEENVPRGQRQYDVLEGFHTIRTGFDSEKLQRATDPIRQFEHHAPVRKDK